MSRIISAALILILIAMFPLTLLAKKGSVKLNDGRTLTGDIEETDTSVTVSVRGIKTTLARGDVASIDYGANLEKEFNDRMAKLEANDAKGRVELARWAFDQEKYDLAQKAVDEALATNPNNTDAATLQATIRSQRRMERAATRPSNTQPAATATTGPGEGESTSRPTSTAAGVRPVISADEINLIRQAELQQSDTQVRVLIQNDLRKKYVTQQNMTIQQFNNMTTLQQAMEIINNGDANMRREVKIQSDPGALLDFRRVIQPGLLANCATSGCHGGSHGAGGFWLLNPADNDASTYTNFYMLQTFRKPRLGGNALFGGGELRLIDRTHPQDSLMLNYGLPTAIAQIDHPAVQDWRPQFRAMNDPSYIRVSDWITKSLKPVDPTDPTYGITYTSAATQPTSMPASMPASQPSSEPTTAPVPAVHPTE